MNISSAPTVMDNTLVGDSEVIRNLRRNAQAASLKDGPVLIEGDRGVGKDTLAKAMHFWSGGSADTFLTIGCVGANASATFDARVTEHEQGEDTKASATKTLFFDSIGDLGPDRQARLVHLLDSFRARSVRVVCATSVPLRPKVLTGRFRSDLYERISEVTLFVPPLRERRVDIPLLAFWFLKRSVERHRRSVPPFSCELMNLFLVADWPGNVRELENTVSRYVRDTSEESLIEEFRSCTHARLWTDPESISLKMLRRAAIRDCDCKAILVSLNRSNWNRRRVARELQISYRSLLNTMRDLGLPMKRRLTAQHSGEPTEDTALDWSASHSALYQSTDVT